MVKAKVWIKQKEFEGFPTNDHFKLVKEDLPDLKDGDVLLEATFLTVDPYMRIYGSSLGIAMPREQVARVIESKNPDYAVGTEWVCYFGWRSHTVFNPNKQFENMPPVLGYPEDIDKKKIAMPGFFANLRTVREIPKLGSLPSSLALGILGMPGATAYLGLLDKFVLHAGETVLVNGAAGAVGNIAGQIAKIKGCKVIGYAGSDEKVKWLREELGFDFAFNYKKVNLSETLKESAPDGIDFYFDNVGGDFSDTVISQHMAYNGRVIIIGNISSYNMTIPTTGSHFYMSILFKQIKIGGYLCPIELMKKWHHAFEDMIGWIKEEKLKYREHITEGFDNMVEAFQGLFTGKNIGKAIVKV